MKIEDLLNEVNKYINYESFDKGWTMDDENFIFENEYLSVKRIASSNKWNGIPHKSSLSKMWSIVFDKKKDFENLPNYKKLTNNLDINISPIIKGKMKGFYGLRIRGITKEPDLDIINKILNFIFSD